MYILFSKKVEPIDIPAIFAPTLVAWVCISLIIWDMEHCFHIKKFLHCRMMMITYTATTTIITTIQTRPEEKNSPPLI